MALHLSLKKGDEFYVADLRIVVRSVSVSNGDCLVEANGKNYSLTRNRWAQVSAGIMLSVGVHNQEYGRFATILVEAPQYMVITRSE